MPNNHYSHQHSHIHSHDHLHEHETGNIKAAFFLNLVFTLVEITGGFFTNSVAILSDAVHDLGDSLSLGLAWYFQKMSAKKGDKMFSYGYKRFSLLGAIINSIVLIVGSIFILSTAVPRLFHPSGTHAGGMFLLAIMGVIVNGAAMFRLNKGKSMNERVVSLHLLEDVLGWLAVLVGSTLIYFFNWTFIDPLLSICISVFVLYNVYKNMRQTIHIIFQGTPETIDPEEIEDEVTKFSEIDSVHDLHVWSADGSFNISTIHVVLNLPLQPEELIGLKSRIRDLLKNKGIQHVTIETEWKGEECLYENCCKRG